MGAAQARVSPGVPAGGQFAPTARAECSVTLQPESLPAADAARRDTRRRFTDSGRLVSEQHLAGGVPADLPDGTPAYREFHPDGSVAVEKRASQSVSMGYPPGVQVWHSDQRDGSDVGVEGTGGGRVVRRGRLDVDTEGTRSLSAQDGPGGEPAVTYLRADGTTSSITRYHGGGWTHTIDFDGAGDPVCVFTNDQNPAARARTDHVWRDLGIDPDEWAGLIPGQALHYRGAGVEPPDARR